MRVAMVKIRAVGVAMCHGCVSVSMLVPTTRRDIVGMIMMTIVMAMPMCVFACFVMVLVFM